MKFKSKLITATVICSELKVKNYKEILKCTLGDEPNLEAFIETLYEVLEQTTDKDAQFFKNLSIGDLILLLLDIRMNSQGDVIKIVVTKDQKEMSLDLRLDYLRKEMFELLNQYFNCKIEYDNLEVKIECPNLERLLEQTNEEYLYFIKSSCSKKTNKHVEIKTIEQARLLFDKLPLKLSSKIIQNFEQSVKEFAKHNFLFRYGIEDQKLMFLPTPSSLIWFTKLLFNEPLDVFYDNLFYLSHLGHLNAEYIEQCSVGEYTLFVSQLKRTMSSKSQEIPEEEQTIIDDEDAFSGQTEEQI